MIQKLRYQLNSIRKIVTNTHGDISQDIVRKINEIRQTILNIIDNDESIVLSNLAAEINVPGFWVPKNLVLITIDQLISFLPSTEARENSKEEIERIIPASRDVFIIHGHDKTNLLELRKLLKERYNLNPIILNEQASKGRTVIEKFEQEAFSVSYAIGLFTPDDEIETSNFQYYQARPNVIFELGWFYSRLGRDRVSILFKKGTKIHSDLDGIVRIEFINSIEEKILEIERELVAAKIINIA